MKRLYSFFMVLLMFSISALAQAVQTATFTKVESTSALSEGDIIVFAYEPAGAVCAPLNNSYLPMLTENVKFSGNTVEVPQTAQTFTLSKYNGNWQLTATGTTDRLMLDVSGKGAFNYNDPSTTNLAGWGISISDGEARVSRPSDDTYPVLFNNDRFKPYKSESAGVLPSLYKKTGDTHDAESKITLDKTIDFGTVEMGETASVDVNYTAEYLTDEIVWSVSGTDAAYFSVDAQGDNQSGTLTVTYDGKATKTGALDAKVEYLTQDSKLELMEGSFAVDITLAANTIKLTGLAFDNSEKIVYLGETLDLGKAVVFTPADAADKSLTWTTSSQYRATVDENGVVTPLISGAVTITATSVRVPSVSASCVVTIKVPEATGVELNKTTLTMNIGGKETLTAIVLPAGAAQDVTWSSNNTDVATVSSKGVITAKALGEAVITAIVKSNEALTATCAVSVVATTVESITFAEPSVNVTVGSSLQLNPVITPASAAEDNTIEYTSSNTAVATVNAAGIVTGVAEGQAVITASVAGKTATVQVNVVAPNMFAKVVSVDELKAKDTIILARKTSEWSVVAGPRNGKILTPLTENITITDNGAAADEALRLVLATEAGGFTLTPVGASKALAESGGNDFVEANTKNNKVWEFVADENGVYVHNIGNTNAYIKYHQANKAIRPYKVNTVGAELIYVYVRPYVDKPAEIVHPTSVSLNKTSLQLDIDGTFQLVATVSPANADNKAVTWTSSDEAIAVVTPQGIVRAIAAGEAVITATTVDGGLTAECAVTVKGSAELEGQGTEEDPYTVADVIALDNKLAESAWVMGYIWGSPKSGTAIGDNTDTSIALGDEEDYVAGASFVPVELPKGEIRTAVGLATTPDNKGRKIKVYGSLKAYFGVPGVKSTSKYVWLDDITAIDEIDAQSISVAGGIVKAQGLIEIYNIAGSRIASGYNEVNINSVQHGIYIIRTAEKTIKIVK